MAQFFRYPASGSAASNPSVAPDGGPIPGSATVVAGENPSGNVQVLQTDSSGALIVSPLGTSSTVNARLQDGAGNPITSQVSGSQRALDVGIDVAGVQIDPRQIRALTSSDLVTVVQPTGTNLHTVVDSSALPTGASTSANQTTTNTSLSAILSNQTNGTQTSVVTQPTGTNLHVVVDSGTITLSGTSPVSGTVTANQGTPNATPWNENISEFGGTIVSLGQKVEASSIPVTIASDQSSLSVTVGNFPATQPVSGTVTANQGTANATPWNENIAQVAGATVQTGHGIAAGSLRVELPTDGTGVVGLNAGSNNIGSITNITGTVSLPTGASTSANQTNGTQKTQISTPTALTVTNAAITVGTTAVRLTVSGSAPASTRVVLVATPDSVSTAVFYIGTSTVTNSGATRGVEIVAGQSFIANNDAGDYWIVSSTATQTVTVMEQS